MHLYTDEGNIDTTANHPFYVIGKGWGATGDLVAGDEVYNLDGTTSTILGSEIEVLDEPVLVYNLEVEDFHTYFVCESRILVHNVCNGEIPWSSKNVKSAAEDLENGALSVTVANRSQAEELFLGLYQGDGYINTSGWSSSMVSDFYGSRGGTYHWDEIFDNNGVLIFHSANNPDGKIPHLQIHPEHGKVIRIFFGG